MIYFKNNIIFVEFYYKFGFFFFACYFMNGLDFKCIVRFERGLFLVEDVKL